VPEVDEEDDKAAELEALLEQFREPEEAPRKQSGPLWLVLAMVAAVAGCWLALRATEGTILNAKGASPGSMKPGKVKDRTAYYSGRENVDAEADYRERCKKGMTAREVRWIVEDFFQAGLAEGGLPAEVQDTAEILSQTAGWREWKGGENEDAPALAEKVSEVFKSKGLQLASRQQRWYADALADGLRLDRAQRKEAYQSGRKLVEELGANFPQPADTLEWVPTGPPEAGESEELDGEAGEVSPPASEGSPLLVPARWLQDERSAPWEMCPLRPDQRAILSATESIAEDSQGAGDAFLAPAPSSPPSSPWYNPERVVIEGPEAMRTGTSGGRDPNELMPSPSAAIHHAVGVFPFTADQDKRIAEDDLPALLKSLHPAQFRMLLLLEPGMAETASEALATQGE
jgi:hypothetical protein